VAGNLLRRHAGKKAHFDDVSLARIKIPQAVQGIIEREDSDLSQREEGTIQRGDHVRRAALPSTVGPSPVNQDLLHHARGNGEKMRAIGDRNIPVLHKPDESLVDQGGGLECQRRPLTPQITRGDATQLGVRQREVLIGLH